MVQLGLLKYQKADPPDWQTETKIVTQLIYFCGKNIGENSKSTKELVKAVGLYSGNFFLIKLKNRYVTLNYFGPIEQNVRKTQWVRQLLM